MIVVNENTFNGKSATGAQVEEPYNSIFQRDWWLDTVAPGAWQALTVHAGERLVARLPIVSSRRWGFRMLTRPCLTQTLGPWLAKTEGNEARQLANEKKWLDELIEQLPPFDYFCQPWHYSTMNWFPFLWHGFDSTSWCTYVIDDLTDMSRVWNNYRDSARREIRKAQKMVKVVHDLPPAELYRLALFSFGRWKRRPAYSCEFLTRVVNAARDRNAGKLFFAIDPQGKTHAALFLVWDRLSAYYLVGGADPELRNSGAMSLLMHQAIEYSATVTKVFDFEGSAVEPINRFVRSFGSSPRPYLIIRGFSRRMKILNALREMRGPIAFGRK